MSSEKPADGVELLSEFGSQFAHTDPIGPLDELIVRVAKQINSAIIKLENADSQFDPMGRVLDSNEFRKNTLIDCLFLRKPLGPQKLEQRSLDTIMSDEWVLISERVITASDFGSTRKKEIELVAKRKKMEIESVERRVNRYAAATKLYIKHLEELNEI